MPIELSVRGRGARLSCTVRGEGEPALLIMGLGVPQLGWKPQLAALSKSHLVATFDQRGCGASDSPGPPYSVATLADDARAVMDALGFERAHVVGMSLGGLVAQELALRHPERIRSLALCCTFPRMTLDMHAALWSTTARSLWAALRRGAGGPRLARAIEAVKRRWNWLVFGDSLSPRQRAAVDEMLAEFGARELLGLVGQASALLGYDSGPRLAEIRAPTLVVGASRDLIVPYRALHTLASGIAGAALAVLEGPHGLNFARPRAFNRTLARFWSAVERAGERDFEPAELQ